MLITRLDPQAATVDGGAAGLVSDLAGILPAARPRRVSRADGRRTPACCVRRTAAEVEAVMLDSRRVQPGKSEAGLVAVALPRVAAPQEHVVEIWQSFSRRQPAWGRVALQAPAIQGPAGRKRVYWQLALPPNQRLLFSPADDDSGNAVAASRAVPGTFQQPGSRGVGALDRRQPPGTVARRPLPCYLFSGFGEVAAIEVAIAPRWAIVLVLSGFALTCGLLLIYVPRLRHPAALFLLGVAALGGDGGGSGSGGGRRPSIPAGPAVGAGRLGVEGIRRLAPIAAQPWSAEPAGQAPIPRRRERPRCRRPSWRASGRRPRPPRGHRDSAGGARAMSSFRRLSDRRALRPQPKGSDVQNSILPGAIRSPCAGA